MKHRRLFLLAALGLSACAADYVDVGYDHAAVGTGGSGGGSVCAPGETRACYGGPDGTEGQGLCHAGQEICNTDGSGFGPCTGEVTPNPENCGIPGDEDCDGAEVVCEGKPTWGYRVGDGFQQVATSVAVDSSGDVLLAGRFIGAMDFGAGLSPLSAVGADNGFVAKISAGGVPLWALQLTGNAIDIDAIATTAGKVVVAGYFDGALDFGNGVPPLNGAGFGDAFVAELDAAGVPVWARRFGDSENQHVLSVAIDGEGNILLAGIFAGVLDFGDGAPLVGAGKSDLFVAKLDPSGSPLWAHGFGDAQCQGAQVAADSAGNVVVAGQFDGVLDPGSGALLPSAGSFDAFVAKLSAEGSPLWARRFGDSEAQVCTGVAVDKSGNIALAGGFKGVLDLPSEKAPLVSAGDSDVFVAMLDGAGVPLWAQRFGNDQSQYAMGIVADEEGNIVVTGIFDGTIEPGGGKPPLVTAGQWDVFLAKLDHSGGTLWAQRFGDNNLQWSVGVATSAEGNIALTGFFDGTIELGGGKPPLSSAGNLDVFTVLLGP